MHLFPSKHLIFLIYKSIPTSTRNMEGGLVCFYEEFETGGEVLTHLSQNTSPKFTYKPKNLKELNKTKNYIETQKPKAHVPVSYTSNLNISMHQIK